MQEERIDYQDVTGLVEGSRHSPNKSLRKIHDCRSDRAKDVRCKLKLGRRPDENLTEAQGSDIGQDEHALGV